MATAEQILYLLAHNDRAVGRALVVLYRNQTADERAQATTNCRNGTGFNSADARAGTFDAQSFLDRGYLTPGQLQFWRAREAGGNMRIGKYVGQLQAEADALTARKLLQQLEAAPKRVESGPLEDAYGMVAGELV